MGNADQCEPTRKKITDKSLIAGPTVRYVTRDILDNKQTNVCPIASGVITYNYRVGIPTVVTIKNTQSNKQIFFVNFNDFVQDNNHVSVNIKFYGSGGNEIDNQTYNNFNSVGSFMGQNAAGQLYAHLQLQVRIPNTGNFGVFNGPTVGVYC